MAILSENLLSFVHAVYPKTEALLGFFGIIPANVNEVKMLSIILTIAAVGLFVLLIVLACTVRVVYFVRSKKNLSKKSKSFFEPMEDSTDTYNLVDSLEFEKELERDLEREIIQKKISDEVLLLQKQIAEEKNINKPKKRAKKEYALHLDWEKNKTNKADPINAADLPLSYKQAKKSLNDLIGLAIDMIGRDIEEVKIAQTLLYKNQGECSEDDIMQLIVALKAFIDLCIKNQFDAVKVNKNLPSEVDALRSLCAGDPNDALALLEASMDYNVEKAALLNGKQREAMFMQTSDMANIFGSIATLGDNDLSLGAYELSVELNPTNVNSWSKLANAYFRSNDEEKAVWAASNVLEIADKDADIRHIANANNLLSQYYAKIGNAIQASALKKETQQIYEQIGITQKLERQELDVISVIEQNRERELDNTLSKILSANSYNREYA